MMKVLITGCFGTTGSSLVKYLLDNTDDIICGVDNFYKEGSRDNCKEIVDYANEKRLDSRFYYREVGIDSPYFYEILENGGVQFDEIYNLAAIVETPRFYDSPYETHKINCDCAIDLFEWACKHGIKKFVNASSSEIYGHANVFPTSESALTIYDSPEESTRWSYAHGKILTEYIMNQIAKDHDIEVCHLRYANVYGEHDLNPVHVIPYFLDSIIKNKDIHANENLMTTKRTFLNNDDSTLGTYLAMKNMKKYHAYNIGSAVEFTINELLTKCIEICKEYGYEYTGEIYADIKLPGDPVRRILDTSRAKDELGFECKVSLDEGIRRMIEKIISRDEVK